MIRVFYLAHVYADGTVGRSSHAARLLTLGCHQQQIRSNILAYSDLVSTSAAPVPGSTSAKWMY